jgi:AraC family transcriptional regulator
MAVLCVNPGAGIPRPLSEAMGGLTALRIADQTSLPRIPRTKLAVPLPGQAGEAGAGSGLAPWQAKRVVAHVLENLSRRVLVADLAAIARLSESHFSRAFRRQFGQPPRSYIIERRLDRAMDMLSSSDLPLCDIAIDCGFADQSHLSRFFRRRTGIAPHAWRALRSAGRQLWLVR